MFVARRAFLFNGHQYKQHDVIKGFPENFGLRPEALVRGGFIDEKPDKVRARKVMAEVKPAEKSE